MHHVIELHFDPVTENHIRSLWRILIDRGYAKDGDFLGACPHISLTSSEPVDPEVVKVWFSSIADSTDLKNVEFSFIGVFPEPAKVLFLGVTPSKNLMEMQGDLYSKLFGIGIKQHPLYAPNKIVFHTTLVPNSIATEISEPLLTSLKMKPPTNGSIERIALVEYPGGKRLMEQQLRA